MHEKHQIFARVNRLLISNRAAALATVVSTTGSTYRRPGARLLVTDSENLGAVSAGCLEDEVIKTAKQVIKSGAPRLLRFDTTEEMDVIAGTGLGCRGTIEVFIEPVRSSDPQQHVYSVLSGLLAKKKTCLLGVVIESDSPDAPLGSRWLFVEKEQIAITQNASKWDRVILQQLERFPAHSNTHAETLAVEREKIRIYAERIEPADELVIFGAGFDAQPLAALAVQLGFEVTLVDHRPDYLLAERFPGVERLIHAHPKEYSSKIALSERAFAVVMTHNYLYDQEILSYLLDSKVTYIGQIGPRSRTEELLRDIEKAGGKLGKVDARRLHGPVGLDLGAETPEEIALSIISEITAIRHRRSGGSLSTRNAPIHQD